MKTIAISLLALGLFAGPGYAADFSGSFGRSHLPACNSVDGNWVGAGDSCPPLGNGSGFVITFDHSDDVVTPPPCPPKQPTA